MKLNLTYGIYEALGDDEAPCYLLDDEIFLCFDKLSDYFELSDKPENIIVRITKKEALNSYLVDVASCMEIYVLDSRGKYSQFTVNDRVCDYLKKLGGSAYVSVIA